MPLEDFIDYYGEDSKYIVKSYNGCKNIDDIDNIVNYETDIYSGDRKPLNHDTSKWYEI